MGDGRWKTRKIISNRRQRARCNLNSYLYVDGTSSVSLLDSILSTLLKTTIQWCLHSSSFCLIVDDTEAPDCILEGWCNLPVLLYVGAWPQKLTVPPQRKSPCHFLHRESLRFFSYFFLLSLFVLSLGLQVLVLLSSTSYVTAAFMLASGHPGLEIKILYPIQSCSVKYMNVQPRVEDACVGQYAPDMWTNLCDWTCECTSASLKVWNLKIRM